VRSADTHVIVRKKNRLVQGIVALGVAATLASGALARPAAAAPRWGTAGGRDDMRETITLLMMVRMKNELGLTQQQYEQVLPRVEERERSRRENLRARREKVQKLRESLAREGAKDAEFTESVEALLALDESDRKQEVSLVSDLRKILTPRQQAQLVLFRQRFRQWMEGRMRDAQELRQRYGRPGARGGAGASGAPPADRDDDAPETTAPERP